MSNLKYICDKYRHLICVPYSIENLHIMAEELDLKRCWFHKNHYDIPKRRDRRLEIEAQCRKVNSRTIVDIIRSPKHAEAFLSEPMPTHWGKPSKQLSVEYVELKYNGFVE